MELITVFANNRTGGRVEVKCGSEDTIGEFKILIAAKSGTKPEKIVLKRGPEVLKDQITLGDYEIHDGTSVDLY